MINVPDSSTFSTLTKNPNNKKDKSTKFQNKSKR